MGRKALIIINIVVWGLLALNGVSGYQKIVAQHVEGFPNSGQITLYLTIPIIITLFSVIALLFIKKLNIFMTFFFFSIILFSALPYIVISGGGV
jgi:hypothetical protein